MSNKQKQPVRSNFRKHIISFWCGAGVVCFSVAGLFVAVAGGLFGPLPSFEQLENPKNFLASEVYSADSALLGKYYQENRSYAHYEDLAPNLINALIATEDIRFHQHAGIDLKGTTAIFYYMIRGKSRGASTITQQLAKNLFPRKRFDSFYNKVVTKLKEWVTAIKIERHYTKQEILTMYFNTVPFSHNAFGIKAASQTFFSTSPDSLKAEQSAVLVGMLKGTTLYNPLRNPERAKQRRNVVIGQMKKYGYLSETVADSLKELPIELSFQKTDHITGLAAYFREHLRTELTAWCQNHLKPDSTPYNLYQDGLKIYTTIDSRMQRYAEAAVQEHLSELQDVFYDHWQGRGEPWGDDEKVIRKAIRKSDRYRLLRLQGHTKEEIMEDFEQPREMTIFTWQGERDTIMSPLDSIKYYLKIVRSGFMAMEPGTGHIKAWVGGINYKYFQYDHVRPSSKRQVGSTFKPFVYAVAIDNGWSPCHKLPNMPITFEAFDNWTPKNADGEVGGMMSMKEGLARSVNIITAQVMKQFGPKPVIDLARKLGITSHIDPYPSIALGTPDISVYELVGAYAGFANKGVWTKPTYLTRIEDRNGNLIQEFKTHTEEALSEEKAYLIINLLQNVVEYPKGTAFRLRFRYNIPRSLEIAGKTGTTQKHADGWFIGTTPDLTAGVWSGWEYRNIRFRSQHLGQGANMALPIWAHFMKKVLADESLPYDEVSAFEKPETLPHTDMDCDEQPEALDF